MITKQDLKDLMNYLLYKDKKFFMLIAAYGVIVALLTLALPLSIQVLITSIIYTALIPPVLILGLVLLILISFSAFLGLLQKFLIEIYKRNSFVRLSSDIILKAIYSDHNNFRAHHTSDLSSRYFEIFNVQRNASELIVEGLLVVLTIIVSFILSSFYHPYFLGLNLIILLVIWLSWRLFYSKAVERAIILSESKFAVFAWIDDIFRMSTFFKSGITKNYAIDKGQHLVDEYISARRKYWSISFTQMIILAVLYVAITVVLVTFGSILVINGQLSLGQLVAAEILYTTSLYGASKLSIYYDKYYSLIASADELRHVFLIENERLGKMSVLPSSKTQNETPYAINFANVEYTDKFGIKYLFNTGFHKGSNNLIFATDSNIYSVFSQLITYLNRPDDGYIEFLGSHLANFDQQFYRNNIVLIDNSSIFGCTINEFLSFGLELEMSNHVEQVLEAVGLIHFIHELEHGGETALLGDGYPLYEQHIIALKLAKAILINPAVIVINENFDKLDQSSQQRIISYINQHTEITFICLAAKTNHQLYDNYVIFDGKQTFATNSYTQFNTMLKKVNQGYE